ncbi:MAG: biopolymer transporter ExbD [Bacteroidetes bacterium]|nr:biopolymer transporter ExbD [Bacteroidota bacterium]MBU1718450.1 biopolymer transporter ExbD [Bacteroidota bacterium]
MAIKTRNKRNAEFNTSSMSDLVFLLLIFFMLTSTLVSPNAVKLFLPSSSSKTVSTPKVTVYIDENNNFYINTKDRVVTPETMADALAATIGSQEKVTVVLKADKTVELQEVVAVIDAINDMNNKYGSEHKLILATSPK